MVEAMCGRGRSSLQSFLLEGITLTNERNIGDGSYATVVPLRFRGLKCAGKKLHAVFFENASPQEKERTIERFQEECQLLSRLKHPNIVQFLGVHFEGGSDLPFLVMEFLHCTLSECVDRYGVLPEQLGMGILDDVATGLCYLHGHQPSIVHRDLSANNVLLSSDMKAKISDLGVAKILNLTPARMSQMTKCPGTPAYMPPEALRERPSYDAKLDCFSVGVMVLHVLCGRWPYPSEPTRVHPRKHNKVIGLTEVERREEYFQQVRGDHPLMEFICACLDNDPSRRPDAVRILGRLRQESPPSFVNKMELLSQTQTLRNEKQGLSEQLEQLREVSNEVDGLRALVRTKDEEKRGLSQHLEKLQRELAQSHRRQERLELTHSIDMEQVQCRVREFCTEVEGLRAVVRSKENVIQAKEIEKQQVIQAKEMEKLKAIQAKQQAIQAKEQAIQAKEQAIQAKEQVTKAKEMEKQQAIHAKEMETQQAIQAKEMEKQQAIQAKEQAIKAEEQAIQAKEQAIEAEEQAIKAKEQAIQAKDQDIQAKEIEKQQAIQAKEIEKQHTIQAKEQVIQAKERDIQAKEMEKQQAIQAKEQAIQTKERDIQAKEIEKQQAIQAKEMEKQQAIHAKEMEKQQASQKMEMEKNQAIQAKEMEKKNAIQAKEMEKQQAIQEMEMEKNQAIQAKEQAIQAKKKALKAKEKTIQANERAIEVKNLDLAAKEKVIESQRHEIVSRDALLAERDATLGKTRGQVKTLQGYLSLNQIVSSL